MSASLATENPIDDAVYDAITESVRRITEWVRDELGLHNERGPITSGSTTDEPRKRSDLTEDPGTIRWRIEDAFVASVFVGLGQEEPVSVGDVLDEIERGVQLDFVGGAVTARLAREGVRAAPGFG